MANRVFIDTSFVLALINELDQYHKQAEALSFKFEESVLNVILGVAPGYYISRFQRDEYALPYGRATAPNPNTKDF